MWLHILLIKFCCNTGEQITLSCADFIYLTVLINTSGAVLNNNGESRQIFLVLDLRGNASCFSPFSMMLAMYYLDCVWICLIYSQFVWCFYHERMLCFIRCILCISGHSHMVFIPFVNVIYQIIDLLLNYTYCNPGINSKFSLVHVFDLFDVSLELISWYFAEGFYVYVRQEYWSVVLFLCYIFI